MSDILSQKEIDQLLTALSSGTVETDDIVDRSGQRRIKVYDFKRPDKFPKEQIRTVQIIHETFARLTTTSLSTQLRSLVQIRVASVDQLTYEEFIRSIPNPTTIAMINMDPLKGSAVLELDPTITFAFIDRLFGGQGIGMQIARDLTEIEQSVIEGIIVRILGNMRESWSQVLDLRPRLVQVETNSQFAQVVPPTEMVLLVTLETKVGEVEGMINLCLPYITIKPILSKLSAQYWYSAVRHGSTTEDLMVLRDRMSDVEMSVSVEVGSVALKVRDLLALQVGDVVRLINTPTKAPFVMKIEECPKFYCRPGMSGKRMAIQVLSRIELQEDDEFEELRVEEGEL